MGKEKFPTETPKNPSSSLKRKMLSLPSVTSKENPAVDFGKFLLGCKILLRLPGRLPVKKYCRFCQLHLPAEFVVLALGSINSTFIVWLQRVEPVAQCRSFARTRKIVPKLNAVVPASLLSPSLTVLFL